MAIDTPFGNTLDGTGMYALRLENITPSDSTDNASMYRQIYCGVGGDINLIDSKGNTVLHKNVASGSYIGPFYCARVKASLTTATNLIGYV